MKNNSFSSKLRSSIESEIVDQYDNLVGSSLRFLQENINTCRKCAFDEITKKEKPFGVDLNSCVNFILDSRLDINKTTFGFKVGDGTSFSKNDIRFPFTSRMPQFPKWGTEDFLQYRKWRDDLEYSCEAEFWMLNSNEAEYKKFGDINIFNDKVLIIDEMQKAQYYSKFQLSKDAWLGYVASLTQLFFPMFQYAKSFSTSKIRRYLTEISEGIWFGFEYDESGLSYEIKKGTPVLPDYYNLILINTQFNKAEKVENYYYQENSGIMSLGILGNPFFYHPSYILMGYKAVDEHRSSEMGVPYLNEIIELANNKYLLSHSKRFNESMKKHAFFYTSLLSSTSENYLDYLKNVLLAALGRCCSE